MTAPFRVGLTRDFLGPDGSLSYGDIGVGLLDAAGLHREFLAEPSAELRPEQVRGYDALLVLGPRVSAASLESPERLLVIARFGVGYDSIDVDACTRAGVALTITPDGVRRPVATAAMALLLALSHKVLIKDRLTRDGRWGEKLSHMGTGLTGRTLGIIGIGNIGRDLAKLARPFDLQCIAHDPHVLVADDVELMSLDDLMRRSDFVCVCCALTPETRHLINTQRLALMKPTAYLINVARGPIVDQLALTRVLTAGAIAGAGLDVFEQEPISADDPLLTLDNVIVAPHALCWTDECFRGMGESACRSIVEISQGSVPQFVVNRGVIDNPLFRAKLKRRQMT
jgi:phosphoglycerate dehydrogenase-like enzyme